MDKKAILASTTVPDIQHTVPEVFIFESLGKADEKAKRFDALTEELGNDVEKAMKEAVDGLVKCVENFKNSEDKEGEENE